jgi:hypothetical protein
MNIPAKGEVFNQTIFYYTGLRYLIGYCCKQDHRKTDIRLLNSYGQFGSGPYHQQSVCHWSAATGSRRPKPAGQWIRDERLLDIS